MASTVFKCTRSSVYFKKFKLLTDKESYIKP